MSPIIISTPRAFFKMERETRFELATSTLARLHSTAELFPLRNIKTKRKIGGGIQI